MLFGGGLATIVFRGLGLPDQLVGGLAGALFGASATLFGVLIQNFLRQRHQKERVGRAQAVVTAELVGVSAGLIGAYTYLTSATESAQDRRVLPSNENLDRMKPRAMPFTDSLGELVLHFSTRQVDVLATLRSNLAVTAALMDQVTSGRRGFGVSAGELLNSVRHDLALLAEAFSEFAPDRQLQLPGNPPELATTLLRRLSQTDATA